MGIEIDVLAVGTGEKSGDAIAIRIGDLLYGTAEDQFIITIDGGTKDSGENLANLVLNRYGSSKIDLAISTHLDIDHVSGMTKLFEKLDVKALWMHLPWNHSDDTIGEYHDGRMTPNSLSQHIKDELNHACEIEQLALDEGIEITEPFQGLTCALPDGGSITVLGPTVDYYHELVVSWDKTPAAVALSAAADFFRQAAAKIKSWFTETLDDPATEQLSNGTEDTQIGNQMSAVILIEYGGKRFLFCGDAGKEALHLAADYAALYHGGLKDLTLLCVPHHGSQRNLEPALLDKIWGAEAIISAGPSSPKHPSQKVINSLNRRGMSVAATKGQNIWYHWNAPTRSDYSALTPLEFVGSYEE